MTEPQAQTDLAALFTSVANGKALAAVCSVNGVKGRVLENAAGTLAVLDDSSPEAFHGAAEAVSAVLRDKPLLALERRDGQVTIWKYEAGVQGEKLPPGLALNDAPGVVLTIVTGEQSIDELAASHPEKVYDARMGRFKAIMELRKLAKQAKKQA